MAVGDFAALLQLPKEYSGMNLVPLGKAQDRGG